VTNKDGEIPLKYDENIKMKNFSEVSDKDELQYTIASTVEDLISNKQSSLEIFLMNFFYQIQFLKIKKYYVILILLRFFHIERMK
jgi:hypothetical protein